MNEEKWHKRLLWLVIGAVITVIITAIFTPLIDYIGSGLHNIITRSSSNAAILSSPNPTPAAPLIQLKYSYSGTLVGGAHSPISIGFTFTSQDQDGNIVSTLSIANSSGDGNYDGTTGSCMGTLNRQRHIDLKCHDYPPSYGGTPYPPALDTYEGDVLSDGSIKGQAIFQEGLVFDWNMS